MTISSAIPFQGLEPSSSCVSAYQQIQYRLFQLRRHYQNRGRDPKNAVGQIAEVAVVPKSAMEKYLAWSGSPGAVANLARDVAFERAWQLKRVLNTAR